MNMEGAPIPPQEAQEEKKEISFEHVLAELNKNGAEHPETLELVVAWTISREEAVDAGPQETRNQRSVLFNIDRAQLYVAIGDLDEAENCLYDAKDQAQQEGLEDFVVQIDEKLRLLNESSS
ncbi:MAG: hypothetical protein RLY47_364 [Candidatus Parcubacteria bacterium]|jgi:hypothetical protein